jgi:hypothetical protein
MQAREAKDFLVAQTAEQAALEGVPLSDLEKRMMYFTEGPGAPEDLIKLNEEFEKELDSADYETKISRLLHHAYRRLRKENDQARRNWDGAIKCLRRGDHYLLVMWDVVPAGATPLRDSLPLLASSLGFIAIAFLCYFIASKFEPQWRWLQKNISSPNPHVLFGIFAAIVLAGFLFPRPAGKAVEWLMDHTLSRFMGLKKDEKDSG